MLKAWFPEGLETPNLTLLKVHADTAEYWEGRAQLERQPARVGKRGNRKDP